ncbi:hypothetical protein Nepgr_010445 [Nepenthes gracilis]|uniref:Uncharacterized protein n=1 Tax=Nepenthes gracilis TaxID=150966 RepID=A0AAD3SD37_NEPGR|nr:hypothetical protein Nepgr_010445 [Nepenthes gracilis]
MDKTDKDTADVIFTMLLLSSITTILHSYCGTWLPVVLGSSFTFLASTLVAMNFVEFWNLTNINFVPTMRASQGAIIDCSIFQSFLRISRLLPLPLRCINPVMIAPTISTIDVAIFSLGFPQASSCVGISISEILLVFKSSLYLQGVSQTDASEAWGTSAWVTIPYSLQWGLLSSS